jgi:hypothetical protein
MISYEIPFERYPITYNKQPLTYAGVAAQKNHYAVYMMCVYAGSGNENRLRSAYEAAGKKFDMGKCCLRFKSLDGILLEEVAKALSAITVDDYIKLYEASRSPAGRRCGFDVTD